MQYDRVKYTEITLLLPNIKVVWPVDREKEAEFDVAPQIKPFIMEAAMKYPEWTFYTKQFASISDVDKSYRHFMEFEIYLGSESLGNLSYHNNRKGEIVYVLENKRINDIRERGRGAKTKDLNKAIKLLSKFYGAMTTFELIKDRMTKTTHELNSVHYTVEREFNERFQALKPFFMEYLMENWERIREVAAKGGAKEGLLEATPVAYAEFRVVDKIREAWSRNKGYIVLLQGNDYVVYDHANKTNPEIKDSSGLPEWMRRSIGLLKLIEPDHCLKDVGYKIDNMSFFLLLPEDLANG